MPVLNMGNILSLLVSNLQLMSALPFIAVSLVHMVSEKVAKTREYLYMLGLTKSVYYASWFLTFLVPALFLMAVGIAANYGFGCFVGDIPMMVGFYALYLLSCIMFVFAAQALVSSTVMAMVLAVLWSYLPAQLFPLFPVNSTLYLAMGLIAPWAFNLGVFKKAGAALIKNSFTPFAGDVIGMPALFGMLAVDCVLYSVLAWYLSEGPGEFRPFYFPFTREYWLPQRSARLPTPAKDDLHADLADASMFEHVVSPHGSGIEVDGLGKTFRTAGSPAVNAVSDFSASFGRGMITSLLGHNGAGKTTTISMLVGMLTPTYGDALIEGKSILT
jgi:ABC-type multidrug transport system fused ATPase/permease subunit